MKNVITLALIFLAVVGCKNKAEKSTEDASSEPMAEVVAQEEWTILFDGTSLDAWQLYQGGAAAHWKIEDGALVFDPPTPEERKNTNGEGNKHFNLTTKKEFTSFVLSMEWKIAKGGNSGVMWGVSEDEKYKEPYQTGMEIQVLDNENHPVHFMIWLHQPRMLPRMLANGIHV